MKCPVCNTKLNCSRIICPKCGFNDLRTEFINIAEAEEWKRNSVGAYQFKRVILEIEKRNSALAFFMRSEYDLSRDIIGRFFREDSHIYSLSGICVETDSGMADNILINTKYVIIATQSIENNAPAMRQSIIGEQLLDYTIESERGVIDILANMSYSKPIRIANISKLTASQVTELYIVLSLSKMPELFFEYPFDDSVVPNESVQHPEKVWNSWFDKDHGFYGITTYAHRITHDDMTGEHEASEGVCKLSFSFSVSNRDEFFAAPVSQKFKMLKYINVKASVEDGKTAQTSYVPNSLSDELYLNRAKNSIFIGSQYAYECWEFVEDGMAQNVFNYLATLCDTITQMEYMTYIM